MGDWADVNPVAVLNEGNSRIVEDDGCYVLINRKFKAGENIWKPSSWIFPEAYEALKKLDNPKKEK